jgi:hypothetical protein
MIGFTGNEVENALKDQYIKKYVEAHNIIYI